ncbi:hypothetical protein A3K73_02095 [Candidatus Pacearchaeota archaeon RBG_13_36_9]|nr:MAG: hypothetical protein A3K73_02095 [Candidatus Pacearchaeota archaeon RBG_13_36_9]
MKHTWKITFVLLGMFLITQLIGLAVIHLNTISEAPYVLPQEEINPVSGLVSIVIAFVVAILLVLFLNKYGMKSILRGWFFIVVAYALVITSYSLVYWLVAQFQSGLSEFLFFKMSILGGFFSFSTLELLAWLVCIPVAYIKIYRQNILLHNITELLVYPGIGTVFVAFLFYSGVNPLSSIFALTTLLIAISIYDIWAVNHSGIMQKMAKFQINELKLFAGFFIPYMDKKQRIELKQIKQKYKKKEMDKILEKKKFKVSLAILGGGDVVFPIIASGLFFQLFGLIPSLFITACATISLLYLFAVARKGKFYPAMPFLTGGIFIGMILGWIYSLL